jgi:hypothetical protein
LSNFVFGADFTTPQIATPADDGNYAPDDGTIIFSSNAVDGAGIENQDGTTIGELNNRLAITVDSNSNGNIKGILNNGTINTGISNLAAINVTTTGTVDTEGDRSGNAYGIQNRNSLGFLQNFSNITVTSSGKGTARGIDNSNGGSFSNITLYSAGSINVVGAESSGGSLYGTYNATGIYNHSDTVTNQTIGTITNGSSITATRTGIQNYAEAADATITTLTNSGTN